MGTVEDAEVPEPVVEEVEAALAGVVTEFAAVTVGVTFDTVEPRVGEVTVVVTVDTVEPSVGEVTEDAINVVELDGSL